MSSVSGFYDIQTGDTVYIDNPVSTGFRSEQHFYVAVTVGRVTEHMFYIGDKKYRKLDGTMVSSQFRERVYRLGEKIDCYGDRVVSKDESEDRADFLNKKEAVFYLMKLASRFSMSKIQNVSAKDLEIAVNILKPLSNYSEQFE